MAGEHQLSIKDKVVLVIHGCNEAVSHLLYWMYTLWVSLLVTKTVVLVTAAGHPCGHLLD